MNLRVAVAVVGVIALGCGSNDSPTPGRSSGGASSGGASGTVGGSGGDRPTGGNGGASASSGTAGSVGAAGSSGGAGPNGAGTGGSAGSGAALGGAAGTRASGGEAGMGDGGDDAMGDAGESAGGASGEAGASGSGNSGGLGGASGSGNAGGVSGSGGSGAGGTGGSCSEGTTGAGCGTCVVYVAQTGGNDADDGRTWSAAKASIDAGITAAAANDCVVWVAEGTYVPTYKADPFAAADTATLQLVDGIEIYGGFAGNEHSLAARDIAAHPTVISGEIGTVSATDNLLAVVTTTGSNKLDGVTVSGGERGVYCNVASSIELVNAVFTLNVRPSGNGGGLFLGTDCSATIRHSKFEGNRAAIEGGGIWSAGTLTIEDSTFVENVAGGATGALADALGGAVYSSGALTVRRSTFTSNRASAGGVNDAFGGAIYAPSATRTFVVEGSSFSGNRAAGYDANDEGSAISAASAVLRDSSFSGQLSKSAVRVAGAASIDGCTFSNNPGWALTLEGTISGGERVVRFSTFSGNGGSAGGALYVRGTLPFTLANSTFERNTNTRGSILSGAVNIGSATATVVNSVFARNQITGQGGAIQFVASSGTLHVQGSTFFENTATQQGGAIHNEYGLITLTNDIFWGNTAAIDGNQIFNARVSATVAISYSNVQGAGLNTNGNIDADPRFVSTGTTYDLALQSNSPSVNTGNTAAILPDAADVDADGNTAEASPLDRARAPRVRGAAVDMGAYEAAP